MQTLPFCIRPFLPIFSSISTNFGAVYQCSAPKALHLRGSSSSFHQGKRFKSNVVAEEILIFTLVCASGISENSPAIFKSPIALLELMANHIAFNPTLTTIRIWPCQRGGRDNLLGDRILQSWPTPSEFSILFTIDPPLLTILINSCDPRTQEQTLDLLSGQLVFLEGREYPPDIFAGAYPALRRPSAYRLPIARSPKGILNMGTLTSGATLDFFSAPLKHSSSILITTKSTVDRSKGTFGFPLRG